MSQQLISRSADLKRLRDEGYAVEIRGCYLLVHDVPYVNASKLVEHATLVSELTLAGDQTAKPSTHVAMFTGHYPCDKNGREISAIRHSASSESVGDGLVTRFSFSNKPKGGYGDYYDKMTRYVDIICHPARAIDPTVTPQTFRVIESDDASVFQYLDTASSRAGVASLVRKVLNKRIGIVGLGGTGSYVLDMVAKSPVAEIHLFDSDKFLQHNAFRAPGAAPIDVLRSGVTKANYFKTIYSHLHKHVVAHETRIDAANIDELASLDYCFVCVDNGSSRRLIVEYLKSRGISFVDVGMGVQLVDVEESLIGILRVTSASDAKTDHLDLRLPLADHDDADDAYRRNIQIVDLNALNAALAVIRWKKDIGIYQDLQREHHTTYSVNVNMLTGDECLQ